MKILVVTQYYYPEPFRINEICEELVRRGHQVSVLTTNPNYPDGEIYEGYYNKYCKKTINGVEVIRCKSRPRHKGAVNLALNYISFVRNANRIVDSMTEEYDVVYMYQLSPITSCIPAIRYKKKHKIPIILYCLDIWPESLKGSALEKGFIFRYFTRLSKKIYKSVDEIAVTSPSFVNYLSKLCGISEREITVIYQHADRIDTCKTDSKLVDKYNEYVNFMFMGNIGESQNLEGIVRAVSQVKNKKQMRFHVVGSGSCLEKVKKLVSEMKLEDVFIFHGRHPKDEMPRFYSIGDICVVSLKDEGITGYTIPGKVQEYMSAGKPILAYMNGDTRAIMEESMCGRCVEADNIEGLIEAIADTIECRNRLPELGKMAKEYYENHFTLEQHVNYLEKILKRVIEEKNEEKM